MDSKIKNQNIMILYTSFAGIVNNIFTIFSGLLVLHWIIPEKLGYFNTFTIITGYIVLFHIGIPIGLNREIPYLIGEEKYDEAKRLASATKFWMFSISTFLSIIGVLISFFFSFNKSIR
ncbi:hypothetical protein ACX8XN_04405 [Calditrichota bacterium GD2]